MRITLALMSMQPRYVILQIIKSGLQESEIPGELLADGVKVSGATINRIKTGNIKRTSWEIGSALERLLERRREISRKHAA